MVRWYWAGCILLQLSQRMALDDEALWFTRNRLRQFREQKSCDRLGELAGSTRSTMSKLYFFTLHQEQGTIFRWASTNRLMQPLLQNCWQELLWYRTKSWLSLPSNSLWQFSQTDDLILLA
uniref:Putative secreted protein n=1 Tax=Ixodes ricinus TaxID=34613 RepID=A0A6B0UNH7_IXORI